MHKTYTNTHKPKNGIPTQSERKGSRRVAYGQASVRVNRNDAGSNPVCRDSFRSYSYKLIQTYGSNNFPYRDMIPTPWR